MASRFAPPYIAVFRSFFIFLAMAGLLMQPMCEIWIVAQYQARKAYIAKTLCEKRGITQNTCQGRCYLKKQLAKSKEAERKAQFSAKSLLEKEFPPHRYVFCFQPVFVEMVSVFYRNYVWKEYGSHTSPAFHPPPFST